ncbi:hypothetical protein [Mesorhizobium sp. Cs1321R2N1]|uniref:hypothetical protein n=1 Tax=Mesorhizobium sp. Cs1321R2N1 TaxID=3015174 RepID=UPI00301BACFB
MKQLDFHSMLGGGGAKVIVFPASRQRALARAIAERIEALPLARRKRAWDRAVDDACRQCDFADDRAAEAYRIAFTALLNEEIARLQVLARIGRRDGGAA